MAAEKEDLALADYDGALLLDPKNPMARLGRGNAFARKGRDDLAVAEYGKAIDLSPHYAAAYYKRGLAKLRSGDDHGSEADFAQARANDRRND
jgi:tetratricopeptide (TPR) repeat protein